MKIKKLVVKNYKVFDHLELDFTDKNGDVLDTIVFAGLNGSGKTTILELLKDLINSVTPQYLKEDSLIMLEMLFPKKHVELEITNGNYNLFNYDNISVRSYSEKFDVLTFEYKNNQPRYHLNTVIRILTGHQFYSGFDGFKSEIIALYFYANDKQELIDKESRNVIQTTFGVNNVEIRQNILEIIQKLVFENPDKTPRSIFIKQVNDLNKIFNNLDIPSKLIEVSDKALIFESTNGQKIGFDDLSSGEKMLYFLGFTLNQLNPQDALIMVDQPEDSLHPTWQQQIVRFFQNIGSNNQVILATHSPQIIASVRPESLFVLGIDSETRRVTAHNMADEHKHTHGVEPNRILSEIMGTPLRDYETQQKINRLTEAIKQTEIDPSVSNLTNVEKMITVLTDELGKQDAAIMRFNNELRLLKRKMIVA